MYENRTALTKYTIEEQVPLYLFYVYTSHMQVGLSRLH